MNSKTIPITTRQPGNNAGSAVKVAAQAEAIDVEVEKVETTPAAEADEAESRIVLTIKVKKKRRSPTTRDLAAQEEYTPLYVTPSRRPADQRPAFNPLAWMADGVTGLIEEVRHNDLGLSQAFWTHLYATRREGLLTAQALVESLIARVENKSEEQEERRQRRQRRGSVDIDF